MVTRISINLVTRRAEEKRAETLRSRSSRHRARHPTRDVAGTYLPDLGAEVGQVMFLPDAMSHAPYVQRIIVDQRATCHRSGKETFGTLVLQTAAQLVRGASRLRRFKCYPWPSCGARSHTRSA